MPFTTEQKLAQYKIFTDDLGKIGVRHTEATKFFASLLSALVLVLGLTGTDKPLGPLGPAGTFAIGLVGIAIALLWSLSAAFYYNLYGAKLSVINKIEKDLPYPGFAWEGDELKKNWIRRITPIELVAAVIMAVPFVLVLVASR